MTETDPDAGVIQAVIHHFEKFRLPRLLDIKALVDRGEVLSDLDIQFLEQVLGDAQDNKELADRHPEWQPLMTRVLALYGEITQKALANEQAAARKAPGS
jgi:hypothetical protein